MIWDESVIIWWLAVIIWEVDVIIWCYHLMLSGGICYHLEWECYHLGRLILSSRSEYLIILSFYGIIWCYHLMLSSVVII